MIQYSIFQHYFFQNLQEFAKVCKKFRTSAFFSEFGKVSDIFQNVLKFLQNSENFYKRFFFLQKQICKICLREDDFRVDLEKRWKMRIWTRKSALIQPRTSLGKSDVSWLSEQPRRSWAMTPAPPPSPSCTPRSMPPGTAVAAPRGPPFQILSKFRHNFVKF